VVRPQQANLLRASLGTSVQMAGGHAEYMLAYADATMLLPEGLSDEQAAPIFCAGFTVWSGLRLAQPQPGERLAVIALAVSGISRSNTPKLPGSLRSPSRAPQIRTE
jgi:D-arabinose 1-dehydrogenase-like Zn-dependent alcohol dehydrogenase